MAKPKILSLLAFLFLVLSLTLVSADYQVKNTTTMLFTISKTSGLVNASYNMAENGVLLSNTYCKLTGCSYTGGIVVTGNVNATEVYIGGVAVSPWLYNQTTATFNLYGQWWYNQTTAAINDINSRFWNRTQSYNNTQIDTLIINNASYTTTFNQTYANILNQQCPVGKVVNGTLTNGTFTCITDATGSTDLTNVAYLNNTQSWTAIQNLTKGMIISGPSNITLENTGGGGNYSRIRSASGNTSFYFDETDNFVIVLG